MMVLAHHDLLLLLVMRPVHLMVLGFDLVIEHQLLVDLIPMMGLGTESVLDFELVRKQVIDPILMMGLERVLELGLVVGLLYVLVVVKKLVEAVGNELEAVVSILVMVVAERKWVVEEES